MMSQDKHQPKNNNDSPSNPVMQELVGNLKSLQHYIENI